MPQLLDPRLDILPTAQKEIWPDLSAAPRLSLVLYGAQPLPSISGIVNRLISISFELIRSTKPSYVRHFRFSTARWSFKMPPIPLWFWLPRGPET